MTLLDKGNWSPALLVPPPAPPVVVVPVLPVPGTPDGSNDGTADGSRGWFGEAPWSLADDERDEPEDAVLPPFTSACPVARPELETLLGDAGRDPADALRELGDRLGVPGWDGVSEVAFGRAPWSLGDAPDAAVLYVPGPVPAPGRPGELILAFRRALQALRRARGTCTRQDEREAIVRLVLSLELHREEHA